MTRRPRTGRSFAVAMTAALLLAACAGGGDGAGPDPDDAGETTTTLSEKERVEAALAEGRVPELPPPTDTPSPPADPELLRNLRFSEVTEAAGLAAPGTARRLVDDESFIGGLAVADLTGDGLDDLYVTRVGLPNVLYRNNGDGTFADITEQAGAAGPDFLEGYAAPVVGDVDGDGNPDLFLTPAGRARPALLMGQPDGTFREEAGERGVILPPANVSDAGNLTFGATFGDVDGDGDLDLIISHWDNFTIGTGAMTGTILDPAADVDRGGLVAPAICELAREGDTRPGPRGPEWDVNRSRLFINDGNGRFADGTADAGLSLLERTVAFQPILVDIDRDGDNDLLVTGDFCTSRLFLNDGTGRFRNEPVPDADNAMGHVLEDLDGDGRLDWFSTAISYPVEGSSCPRFRVYVGCSGNRAQLRTADGWTDATDRLGLREGYWGWGAVAVDLNHDGRIDIAMTNGYHSSTADVVDSGSDPLHPYYRRFATDPMRVWLQRPDGTFHEVSEQVGLDDRALGTALVSFDFDGDGDPDLVTHSARDGVRLWRNDLPDPGNWVAVRLEDPTMADPRGIGAEVRITAGDARRTTLVQAGGSFQSNDPTLVHLGLERGVDEAEVTVRWTGSTTEERFTVPAGTVSTVRRR